MTEAITRFFDAWSIEQAEARLAKIESAVIDTVQYSDPRTPATLTGIQDLAGYVAMFSANAPGWSAKVLKCDTVANLCRATIAFAGQNAEGEKQHQYGQYFIEHQGERISRMVGFVGTGEASLP